jgi:hypothetical protein
MAKQTKEEFMFPSWIFFMNPADYSFALGKLDLNKRIAIEEAINVCKAKCIKAEAEMIKKIKTVLAR